ncbi:hypothetical protein GCK32_013422 [Trichostrongylus colubriformis]|uniref:Phosphoenolpyruvate carboxykinase C-terminal P-loop domain-containing protein n=1 Tax=Trichostrongylus colubriformis TaxID=6319 RepID=A0AAN8IAW2_TRICO
MASSEWSVQFRQFWVTTASIYVVEMAIFFIALFLYHHCFFIPRVRLKMYKAPQDEASHSLMKISGMLNDHVDKTQQDDLVDHLHHREDDTQRELSDETTTQAIIFGGRRPVGIPLVFETRSWLLGIFTCACLKSEATAAAEHKGEHQLREY